jgi:hypothetical protein
MRAIFSNPRQKCKQIRDPTDEYERDRLKSTHADM